MPFKKLLTQGQREELVRVVNNHVNAQAAIAAILAKPEDDIPQSVRTVVELAALDAMNALNTFVDGITEDAPPEYHPLSENTEGTRLPVTDEPVHVGGPLSDSAGRSFPDSAIETLG